MLRLIVLLVLILLISGCCSDSGFKYRDPLLRVKQDGYGLGVGRDQYGRPVRYEAGY